VNIIKILQEPPISPTSYCKSPVGFNQHCTCAPTLHLVFFSQCIPFFLPLNFSNASA
jgi:hypothetical protein